MLSLAQTKVNSMEQKYWLRRKRASALMARNAKTAEARLIHLDLAGRYSVRASHSQPGEDAVPPPTRPDDQIYYDQLEAGARFLASQAADATEREVHLGMANRYVALGQDIQRRGRN